MECNDPNDMILLRIKRALPLNVLQDNLIKIYNLYKKYFDDYNIKVIFDDKCIYYYEFISVLT